MQGCEKVRRLFATIQAETDLIKQRLRRAFEPEFFFKRIFQIRKNILIKKNISAEKGRKKLGTDKK